jgi:Ca2+-transporting ATPase
MTVKQITLPSEGENKFREVVIENSEEEGIEFFSDGKTVLFSDTDALKEIIEVAVLCNNANLNRKSWEEGQKSLGDPMEVALLALGAKAGIHREDILETMPEGREEAFDTDSKMMATFHGVDGEYKVAVKGAPEAVLKACSKIRTERMEDRAMNQEDRDQWLDLNKQMASGGLRILAAATKSEDDTGAKPYEKLTFLGLLGLLDPPRKDVPGVISDCKEAGIRILMLTGDHPATAKNIAISLGLADEDEAHVLPEGKLDKPEELSGENRERLLRTNIFARVTPKQKFDLVNLHQEKGAVVAMTGDGVNDAPALKKADIGIAMGKRGTQVAREAADMVLQDDAFKTIVMAISQGRAIFDNIRKFIIFLLSGNVGEIMIVAFPMLVGAPMPILPLQILYLNMIGDVFPALALGVGKGDPSKMQHPPRDSKEPILTDRHWIVIGIYGLMIALPVLGSFFLAFTRLNMDKNQAITVAFLTLAFARLWHVFNMRDRGSTLLLNDVTRNPFIWGALGLCTGLLIAAVYLPGLSLVLSMVQPGLTGWLVIFGMSLIPLAVGQVLKLSFRRSTFL